MSFATLRVVSAGPGASVQDLGRRGVLHLGVSVGGPVDTALFLRAQSALGNDPTSAAIEVLLHRMVLEAERDCVVSLDGALHRLAKGERLMVAPAEYAARYVALAGGVDVPVVLGGRGLLPVAGLGGGVGRYLRAGDVLASAREAPTLTIATDDSVSLVTQLDAVMGPDRFDEAACEALVSESLTVLAASDRTGVRLASRGVVAPASEGQRASTPMVRGALQVTPEGTVIALGPDHPTTGGYPVIAVLTPASSGFLGRLRPGATVTISRAAIASRGG